MCVCVCVYIEATTTGTSKLKAMSNLCTNKALYFNSHTHTYTRTLEYRPTHTHTLVLVGQAVYFNCVHRALARAAMCVGERERKVKRGRESERAGKRATERARPAWGVADGVVKWLAAAC